MPSRDWCRAVSSQAVPARLFHGQVNQVIDLQQLGFTQQLSRTVPRRSVEGQVQPVISELEKIAVVGRELEAAVRVLNHRVPDTLFQGIELFDPL